MGASLFPRFPFSLLTQCRTAAVLGGQLPCRWLGNQRISLAAAAAAVWLSCVPAAWAEKTPAGSSGAPLRISEAEKDEHGWLVHRVHSEYQSGPTKIKILLPDRLEQGRQYRVLYVLPVEAGEGTRWGNGLVEVKDRDLHNRHQLICVLATFSDVPWYADHPTDPAIRQESYLLRVVVPFVERRYAVMTEPEGRLLVGFSKSGWGAFSLLLRHPQVFGRAAAWDAPLAEDHPKRFGMGPIFGTQESFEHYRISALLDKQAGVLRENRRLVLAGYGNFREHHVRTHERLDALAIPHAYRDGPWREHQWHSGWLPEAVELLLSLDSR